MNEMEAEKAAERVEGWLSVEEGRALFRLAANTPRERSIVEIGSWKGKSTVWLAAGSLSGNGAKVYSIDPHTGTDDDAERERQQAGAAAIWSFDDFQKNIQRAGVATAVTPLVMRSAEALGSVKEPVGVLFIDGDHSFEGVSADFEGWAPRVALGGIVAFHDTNIAAYPGIKKVVSEGLYRSSKYAGLAYVDSLTFATKVEKASLLDGLRKRISHVLRYPDDYANKLHWGILPPSLRRRIGEAMSSFSGVGRRP